MSILANKTERKTLIVLAKMVVLFEELNFLDMSKIDDFEACQAKCLLLGIIETNGFEVNHYGRTKRQIIKKSTTI